MDDSESELIPFDHIYTKKDQIIEIITQNVEVGENSEIEADTGNRNPQLEGDIAVSPHKSISVKPNKFSIKNLHKKKDDQEEEKEERPDTRGIDKYLKNGGMSKVQESDEEDLENEDEDGEDQKSGGE